VVASSTDVSHTATIYADKPFTVKSVLITTTGLDNVADLIKFDKVDIGAYTNDPANPTIMGTTDKTNYYVDPGIANMEIFGAGTGRSFVSIPESTNYVLYFLASADLTTGYTFTVTFIVEAPSGTGFTIGQS
jgi:hypothetical protein